MIYFAYGSNMDFDRMRERSPNARFLFPAVLIGYKLAFTRQMRDNKGGAADIRESAGVSVWGVVYHLSEPDDLFALYPAEGYVPGRANNAYEQITVGVHPAGDQQQMLKAVTFTVPNQKKLSEHQKPSPQYMRHLLLGAQLWGLPANYIDQLKRIEIR